MFFTISNTHSQLFDKLIYLSDIPVSYNSSQSNEASNERSSPVANESVKSGSAVKKKPLSLSIVNFQDVNIPPKESLTYNKQTQTVGGPSEREGNCFLP